MDHCYPPEPWDLHGQAVAAVFLTPAASLPSPPPGTTIVTVGGRAIVTAAFFRYEEPSPLTYDELMATVLVRRGWRSRVWIPWIWVDSATSRTGGRELWAIPKELAEFVVKPGRRHDASLLGSVEIERSRGLPGRWPISFRIAQERTGRSVVTPVRGTIRAELLRARWTFRGVLSFLDGRRPLISVRVPRFALLFGRSPVATTGESSASLGGTP